LRALTITTQQQQQQTQANKRTTTHNKTTQHTKQTSNKHIQYILMTIPKQTINPTHNDNTQTSRKQQQR